MNNYTALNEKILEELTNFTANISKGLGKASGKDKYYRWSQFLCVGEPMVLKLGDYKTFL